MKHPIRRRLMFLGFRGLRALAQRLPLATARAVGRAIGLCAYWLLPAQRRLTTSHLRLAWGQTLTAAQRRRIAQRVFRNLGQSLMEWLLLPRLSPEALTRMISSEGIEHLRGALANGRGAIALTAHFGNWEFIPFYVRSLGFEGSVLARRLRHPEYEAFLVEARAARGVATLARGSLKEVATVLRENRIIGMLPDQDMDSLEGVFVDFFGHPAYTPLGPAALSVMTGAPIVPCFLIREGERFRFIVEPPLKVPDASDRRAAVRALTQAWSEVVERAIRRNPDQWVWMHRRWKTQPAAAEPSTAPALAQVPVPAAEAGAPGRQAAPTPSPAPALRPAARIGWLRLAVGLLVAGGALSYAMGWGRSAKSRAAQGQAAVASSADQQMDEFTLTGYDESGAKRWLLNGRGAHVDGNLITVHHPDGIGFEPDRTAYLTASAAQVRQSDRHVRLEHDVTIHTSEGLWLTAPILHWIPDRNEMATDTPVRIENEQMLLRGRGASGLTGLKEATIFSDVELLIHSSGGGPEGGGPTRVTVTCDGALTLDYERLIATFHDRVHVSDPSGDLDADELVVYLDEATHAIRYAEAIGRVRITQEQHTAHSRRAIYEPGRSRITLVGRPSLLVYPSEDRPPAAAPAFVGLAAVPEPAQPRSLTAGGR